MELFRLGIVCLGGGHGRLGLWHLPTDLWVKGYLAMGSLFLTGSSFTLSKTMRDNQEFAERSRHIRGEERPRPLVVGLKD